MYLLSRGMGGGRYLGRHAGGPGVKLEEQVLITETGHELLSSYPIKEILTNN